jgi:hypothetical protein
MKCKGYNHRFDSHIEWDNKGKQVIRQICLDCNLRERWNYHKHRWENE